MRFIKWVICVAVIALWSASVSAQPNNCFNIPTPNATNVDKACDFSTTDEAPVLTSGRWVVASVDNLASGDCPLLNDELPYQFATQKDGELLIMRLATAAVGGRKFTRTADSTDTYIHTRTNRITSINYTLQVLSAEHFTITWGNPFKTCEVVEDYTLIQAAK